LLCGALRAKDIAELVCAVDADSTRIVAWLYNPHIVVAVNCTHLGQSFLHLQVQRKHFELLVGWQVNADDSFFKKLTVVFIYLRSQIIEGLLRLLFINWLFLSESYVLELISAAEVLCKIVAEAQGFVSSEPLACLATRV